MVEDLGYKEGAKVGFLFKDSFRIWVFCLSVFLFGVFFFVRKYVNYNIKDRVKLK